MADFTFRPAVRENVGLLVGIAAGTGGGKTFSAMRLAAGICRALGKDRFAVLDTEAGRAKHYADRFKFDHGDLTAPFTPDRYTQALVAADEANYPVIVVDSTSHVWAGDGGVLDMQEAEFQRMGGNDNAKMASWIRPKAAHKKFVTRVTQLRAHVILCFRAEPKIEMRKEGGKMVVAPKQSLIGLDGWIPICEKNLPFELTASFLMMAQNPGVPLPIKLQEQHRAIFPPGVVIDEKCGERLVAWANGGTPRAEPSKLRTALADLASIGWDAEKVAEKLEHEPTEADVPRLVAFYEKVLEKRTAQAAANAGRATAEDPLA